MWRTDTYWFDVAIVTTVLMLGQIVFGRFVECEFRSRRVLKSLIGVVVLIVTTVWAGREWLYALLAAIVVGIS